MATNIFTLEVLRARHGDCLLLHYGTKTKPGLALIDGGPSKVYKPFLRPRIEELRAERGLDEADPLLIDLMMLSHIDADHVAGLLELTKELIAAKTKRIVQVLDLWHNSFDDIVKNDAKELGRAVNQQFGPASLSGDLSLDSLADLVDSGNAKAAVDSLMVLASIPQGQDLRSNAEKLDIPLNAEADGELIVATDEKKSVDMGKGLKFTVVGPMEAELKKLQEDFAAFLNKPKAERETASVLASFAADDSVTNLSSIVVLAQVKDKKILFTGDALGDNILKALETAGVIGEGGSLHVDVLKCPHHGSDRNVTPEFFERITADHYVFSANGDFGNPDRETIEMLAAARGADDYQIHLTYPVDEIDVLRKKFRDSKKIQPKWSKAKHSLAAFLDNNPDVNDRIVIVEEGVPHTIDLLG
jgi:beta-lactamase superfamily II metal-dependent hydrolase